ncbi:uncharacterized protein LOC124539610 [Vanessa cardui]|uniref:uncharacterized protein LOC124539610 n=1 Tax=Vanessa cardui TaxID=171605 RepID=UPI001F13089A|nr:uncharacterized protein LOC124539610 [Vanessa cardui]
MSNLSLVLFHAFGKPQRPLPFPHLTEFELSDIGKPVHVFEGIDYDLLPDELRNEYHDCYSEQYKCIRSRSQHTPVCGFDSRDRYFKEYFSQCELDLHNCLSMTERGLPMYGKGMKDRLIFFMGEGYRCEIIGRSGDVTTDISLKE